MSKPNDGGPAFPTIMDLQAQTSCGTEYLRQQYNGMSLRAWLAGMALQGIAGLYGTKWMESDEHDFYKTKADAAVAYADALIAELEKEAK